MSPQEATIEVFGLLTDYVAVTAHPVRAPPIDTMPIWKPPSHGRIKINTDVGLHNHKTWKLGAAYRFERGTLLIAAAIDIHGFLKPKIVEALAVRWAVGVGCFPWFPRG